MQPLATSLLPPRQPTLITARISVLAITETNTEGRVQIQTQ